MVYDRTHNSSLAEKETQALEIAVAQVVERLNTAADNRKVIAAQQQPTQLPFPWTERNDSKADMALLLENHSRQPLGHMHFTNTRDLSPYQAPRPFNVKPPPRTSLPPIKTQTTVDDAPLSSPSTYSSQTLMTASRSPERHLPRLYSSLHVSSPEFPSPPAQTLPSLQSTLRTLSPPMEPLYAGPSLAPSRPLPIPHQSFGLASSSYSNQPSVAAISPPRLPTAPSFWRTISRETSSSTPSDQASVAPSGGHSTPASSVPALSPGEQGSTPALHSHDSSESHRTQYTPSEGSVSGARSESEGHSVGLYCGGYFKCTWPGCTAPPFQTQYLLNSHANVHSNTRPHFCPVQGCPRGPGGQGFKRKNEMIRHGLVHQSPGYVCPFCPDQQHKYPRPDNLQRHVRVHHIDRDRDDPLLRDVLAQRPEGGNRGRRRRLGSG